MNIIFAGAIVFVSTMVLNIFWAIYVMHTADANKMGASLSSVASTLLQAFVVTQYLGNKWMIIPACIGAFVGTYLPVHLKSKSSKKD